MEELVTLFIHWSDLCLQHPHEVLRGLKIVSCGGQECCDQTKEGIDVLVCMSYGQVMMSCLLKEFGEEEA